MIDDADDADDATQLDDMRVECFSCEELFEEVELDDDGYCTECAERVEAERLTGEEYD